ncbi:MAG TPA: DNA-processing protein DprA [Microbacteriaceae bacterium]|nr:DNA-processing protein DprA [Microbacteriaceae bacterium]
MTEDTWLGLSRTECERLSGALRASARDPIDVIAAVASSVVAEPGDSVWGECVAQEDAATALEALVSHANVAEFAAALGIVVDSALDAGWHRWRARLSQHRVLEACERASRVSARAVLPGDPAWPPGLFALGPYMPHILYVRGRKGFAWKHSVAMVGARAATGYGEFVTGELVAGIARTKALIVSGAAYGIDGAAHRAALASSAETVAFLAGGIDRLYPSGHAELISEIMENGAVFAEHPCGAAPTKFRFLQRNRLIAAASDATVVIEAGRRSGSLNTAHHAASLGRPLGAVPGPVTSPSSAGCHALLRDGIATCVTDADDVAQLAWEVDLAPPTEHALLADPLADASLGPLALLERGRWLTMDDLLAKTSSTVDEVSCALAEAEIAGAAERRGALWRIR